jgi:alpha-tubulin suppressor-like RCC1 family protein
MPHSHARTLLVLVLCAGACTREAALGPEPPGEPYASVTAAGHTTCALTSNGRAFCWGRGTDGQLGNGGETSRSAPIPVAGGLRFGSLAAGSYHTCGIAADAAAYCWGARWERHGQLGNPSVENGSVRPVRVATELRFVQLTAGQMHTCGLTAEGVAYCWGDNRWGQLGDGTTASRATPVPVRGGERFAALGSGAQHTCGVSTDGRALCWGDNFFGSVTGSPLAHTPDTCGTAGDARCTLVPHALQTDARFLRVAAGDAVSCGVGAEGAWWCWGGSAREAFPPRVLHPSSGPALSAVSVGSSHACALRPDGPLLCFGGNNLGQLGTGDAATDFSPVPVPVHGGHSFKSVAAGTFHTCAVTTEGVAYCWGGNRDGQLGNGSPRTCDGSYPCSLSPQAVRNQ